MMALRPPIWSASAACALVAAAAACGGGGGPSDDPGAGGAPLALQKPVGSGDGQTGSVQDTLPVPLTALVTEGGVPAAGWVVSFTPLAVAGTLLQSVDTTGADGLATSTWVLGKVSGRRQVQATVVGGNIAPLIFSATVTPDPPATFSANGGTGQLQESGSPFPSALAVRVADQFGNAVPGVTVQWGVVSGGATPATPTSATGGDGVAIVTALAGGAPGPAVIQATLAALPADTVTFDLTVVPAATVVTVNSNFFSPATVTIAAGGTIRWVWNSGTHDVSPTSGPATFPASMVQSAPSQYGPLVFNAVGTYHYECNLHAGMTATIVVQ